MTESMEQTVYEENDNQENTNLVCRWNECSKVFLNHASLASHLSEDHVGWKKGDYFCDWSNCARQGAKCHNRFALMMHLRIHTGEKPFECTFPNCGQTFGRMDALVRHKKAEHGEGSLENKITGHNVVKPISTPLAVATATATTPMIPKTNRQPSFTSTTTNATHYSNSNKVKKIPKTSLDTLSKKRPRMAGKKSRVVGSSNHNTYSSEDESDDSIGGGASSTVRASALLSGSADYNQYRLAKAQLHYILRENEMLQDEYESVQKKLKRMRTERRVLLHALMAREKSRNTVEDEDEDDEEDITGMTNFEHIPNDH